MAITFDATRKLIILDSTTLAYTAGEIYSRWKDWVQAGVGTSIWQAFTVIGGEDTDASGGKAPPFFFLRNDLGWRIKRPESNIEVTIKGNLIGTNVSIPILEAPDGNFNPLVNIFLTSTGGTDVSELIRTIEALQLMIETLQGALDVTRNHARRANMQTQKPS